MLKNKNVLIAGLLMLITACTGQHAKNVNTSDTATLFFGGEIVTMEGAPGSKVEAVVSDGDKILFSGNEADARAQFPRARQHNLAGATMFPGFIEQHLHPFLGALTLSIPVIAPEDWVLPDKTWPAANDHDEYIAALVAVEKAMNDPQEILWSWGYHHYYHGDLNRKMLNTVSSDRPIIIWHRSAHEFFMNDAAIAKFGVKQDDIDAMGKVVADQVNLERGHFYEAGAFVYLVPRIMNALGTPQRFQFGLQQMLTMLHQKGVTAYMEPGAFIPPAIAPLYQAVLGAEQVPMYSLFIPTTHNAYLQHGKEGTFAAVEAETKIFPTQGKIRYLPKQVKILFDGAIISQLMMMTDGYLDGHHGEWIQRPEEVEDLFDVFWEAGYQIHVHVNGDGGLERLLAIIERKMQEHPREDHRTTLVHFANSTDEQVKRLVELGCIVSANPYYVTGFADKYAEVGLGPERAHAMVRLAPVEALGGHVSLHSDMPMAPSDPLYLAWTATTRETHAGNHPRPDLALSLHGAMKAITIDAAHSWRMEDTLGSIAVGKTANFTILEQNPYNTGAAALRDIKVKATVFEGVLYPVQ
jgi:predicted amidohydrolase YtcJ